ncbi:MAG: hypothetical protein M1818_002297 [Claussenomyces sp. TS43310]|nr:MAG: hypothetical protein M1818_002297 [Claussenomyces sp. TS43310]
MPPTTIRTAPSLDSYTSLSDHQSQTPTSFFGAKPVLHYHATAGRALTGRDQISHLPIFGSSNDSAQGDGAAEDSQASVMESVDIFVSSENLTLFNPSISTGISIPYPSISLHAIQRMPDPSDAAQEVQGLYMQLELSNPSHDEDEPEIIDLTLLPPTSSSESSSAVIQALFTAVSDCSNLNPDPRSQDDEDMEDGDERIMFEGSVGYQGIGGLPGVSQGVSNGGLPPPFPGSGGWITAENVSEYFDEEGNWLGGNEEAESLGEGAGRVRGREEANGQDEEEVTVNGHGRDDEEENKRPRIE